MFSLLDALKIEALKLLTPRVDVYLFTYLFIHLFLWFNRWFGSSDWDIGEALLG